MLKRMIKSLKKQWVPRCLAYLARMCLSLLLHTCKIKINHAEYLVDTASQSSCILMLWHNRLCIIAKVLLGFAPQFTYNAFISKSRDGDALAFFAQSYKNGRVIRVPHNARHHALSQMITQLKNENQIIIMTPDGPRGPLYEVKQGIVYAAKEAHVNILPLSWVADRFWTLKTWDKMIIPKPFSKITVNFGSPISLSENQPLAQDLVFLKTTLDDLSSCKSE